jgi:hypothetical protein
MSGRKFPESDRRVTRPATALALLLMSGVAMGCSVPVFRYALEHWAGDSYQAVVLHRGPLPDAGQALVKKLRDGPEDADAARANLAVQTADLNSDADAARVDLWKQAGAPDVPWLVISPPRSQQPGGPVFSAPLSVETVGTVLDSPARREIIRRLGEGESAVWVLLESGDPSQDDAAMRLLEARLAYLCGVLELPKLDEQDIRNGLVSVPDDGLKLAFSTLRIARGDPAERAFVPMLLGTEAGLARLREPVVFPVFGQARVLYALVGKGIRHETIDRAASFLIGSCSCQVKEQNPGADLLVTADWKKLIKDQSTGVPDLPTVGEIVAAMPESVTISPRPTLAEAKGKDCCVVMGWMKAHRGIVAWSLACVFLILGWVVARKIGRPGAGMS